MPDLMTVAGIALKTSLLIAIAGLLSVALRRQSAAFSHLLWTFALALCVLMPFAVFFLPSHSVVTLPSTIPGGRSGWGLPEWSLSIWLFGTVCILMRELLSSLGLACWRRHAQPLSSARWAATLARISATEGPGTRRMRVFESRRIASPCTWGVLRPVLLLPTACDDWPESARRSALLHELAHVRRVDALSTLVSRLACAMHWYNPLVWLAAERVRTLQERACDDAVLRAGAIPSEYAQFLLDVAAHVSGMSRPTRLAIGMAHGSSLRSRIVAILDPAATRSQPRDMRVVAACTSLFGFTLLLAMASVAVEPPPPPPLPTMPATPDPAVPAVPAVPPVLPTPPIPPVLPRP